MNNFSNIVQITFCLLILAPDLVNLLILLFKLILFTAEVLSQINFDILLRLQFLLKQKLLSSSFFKFRLRFQKFLLLPHRLLHSFSTMKKFVFHILNALDELLLFGFLLLLCFILAFKFSKQSLSIFFSNFNFCINLGFLSFKIFHDLLLFSFELIFHSLHFFLVFNMDELLDLLD